MVAFTVVGLVVVVLLALIGLGTVLEGAFGEEE